MANTIQIPLPTLKRYSLYLSKLLKIGREEWVSTSSLSSATGVKPITIRKDINYLGVKGSPQKGFPKDRLLEKLKDALGGDSCRDLILVGSWGFGEVYKKNPELVIGGFTLRVCFDNVNDSEQGGTIPIYPIDRLEELIPRLGVSIALLSVEPEQAESMAEKLFSWGITGILNLTPGEISPREGKNIVSFNPLAPLSELLGVMKF